MILAQRINCGWYSVCALDEFWGSIQDHWNSHPWPDQWPIIHNGNHTCLMDWIITPMVWIWTLAQTQLQMVFLLTQFEAWYWLWWSYFWESYCLKISLNQCHVYSPQPVDWSFPPIQAPLQGLGHDHHLFFFAFHKKPVLFKSSIGSESL